MKLLTLKVRGSAELTGLWHWPRRHPVAAMALLLALAAAVRCWHTWLESYDDAYITYVFAESVARGEGLTWHGSRALGTSTPFFAVLLGALSRATGASVPVLGHLLSWFGAWLTSLALVALGRREGLPRGGLLAAWIWLLSPAVTAHLGSEYLSAIGCAAAAAWAFRGRRAALAGALLAAAFALRAEVGLVAPLLALAVAWREPWSLAWRQVARAAAVAIGLTALWLALLAALADGQILPLTLAAKQAQGASVFGYWPSGLAVLGLGKGHGLLLMPGSQWITFHGLSLLGALALLLTRPLPFSAGALVAWGPLHLALVAALGVGFYPWYGLPAYFAAALLMGLAAELPSRLTGRWSAAALTALLGLLGVVVSHAWPSLDPSQEPGRDPRRIAYGKAAELFNRYPEGTRVASFEVGYLGHASRQPVLDLLGLVTPEAPLAAVRTADLIQARRALDPDLLMLPLASAWFFKSIVGDAGEFVRTYTLDRLQLGTGPLLALYRRSSLARQGEVVLDLAPLMAASGLEVRVVVRPTLAAIGVLLPRGSAWSIELPAGPATRFVTAVAPEAGQDAAFSLVLEHAGALQPLDRLVGIDPNGWRARSIVVPALPSGGRLTLACESLTDAHCLLAFPHLEAAAD